RPQELADLRHAVRDRRAFGVLRCVFRGVFLNGFLQPHDERGERAQPRELGRADQRLEEGAVGHTAADALVLAALGVDERAMKLEKLAAHQAAIWRASQPESEAASMAPETRAASRPSRNRMSVGIERMPKRAATDCARSVSTLAKRARVFCSEATRSKAGAMALHGPHQSAQKSTTTGRLLRLRKLSKRAGSSSTGLP